MINLFLPLIDRFVKKMMHAFPKQKCEHDNWQLITLSNNW